MKLLYSVSAAEYLFFCRVFISFRKFSYAFHTSWLQVKADHKMHGKEPLTFSWRKERTGKKGRAEEIERERGPLKISLLSLSPGPGCRKFIAPIKIESKPSLERIYSVQPLASPKPPQLSETPGVNLPAPTLYNLTPLLTGLAIKTDLSVSAKLSYRNQRCIWKKTFFSSCIVLQFT